jgi:hypothetical protein
MRKLRSPTSHDDITPQLMQDVISNVNKLGNLSITGGVVTELPGGISIDVPLPILPRRGRLLEDLDGGGNAKAQQIFISPGGRESYGAKFQIYDPLNKVGESLLADPETASFMPAGICFTADWNYDSQHWEVDSFGACVPISASSPSSESSESSESSPSSESSESSPSSESSESSPSSESSESSPSSPSSESSPSSPASSPESSPESSPPSSAVPSSETPTPPPGSCWMPCPPSNCGPGASLQTGGDGNATWVGCETSQVKAGIPLPPTPEDASEENPYVLVNTGKGWTAVRLKLNK